jgi:hypothetical protein
MTLTIVLLSITVLVFFILLRISKLKHLELINDHQEFVDNINRKPLLLNKGDRGIAYLVTHKGFYTNNQVSSDMVTVPVEIELVSVFGDMCSINVINVHNHISSISAAKHLNRVGSQVKSSDIKWETKHNVMQVSDNEIIILYKEKKINIGGINIEYTGESSPIELIDKLI